MRTAANFIIEGRRLCTVEIDIQYLSKQLAAIWQECIERALLIQQIMTSQYNCATPHSANADNVAL